ncbi:MAG TPA: hypothetical protein VHU89_04125 [Acidobacteriaceae bacterium]|jgi:hypothetical protein|nr:hypothetical protein [Acidobacteriaceae bacterium]
MSSGDWYQQQQEKIRQAQRQADQNRQAGLSGVRQWNTDINSAEYRRGQLEREQRRRPLFPQVKPNPSQNNWTANSSVGGGYRAATSAGKKKSGAGGGVFFALLVIGGLIYFASGSSSSSPAPKATAGPVSTWATPADRSATSARVRATPSNGSTAPAQGTALAASPSNASPANRPDAMGRSFAESFLAEMAERPQYSTKIQGSDTSPYFTFKPGDVFYRAKHKGFGGCDGELLLNAAGMRFACPGNSSKSFFVPRSEIEAADDDGVRLFAKDANGRDAYHFSMGDDASKDDVHALFQAWLNSRGSSGAAAGQAAGGGQ